MTDTKGTVVAVNGNMISVKFDGIVALNEVGYVQVGDRKLKSEVIRIRGDIAQLQVFEITKGIEVGDPLEFTGDLLSVELGPGLLGQVYDGFVITSYSIHYTKLYEIRAGNHRKRGNRYRPGVLA